MLRIFINDELVILILRIVNDVKRMYVNKYNYNFTNSWWIGKLREREGEIKNFL